MEIKVVKYYDTDKYCVEMSAYGFTYHLVPTSKEISEINKDAIISFLTTPSEGKETSDELGD